MTIRRGEPWGAPAVLTPDVPMASDDRSAARSMEHAIAAGVVVPEVALGAGDLARTMGGGGDGRVAVGATLVRAPVDVLRIMAADGRESVALAHVVVRSGRRWTSWWRGALVFVMNAQYLGGFDVAPRSHPNDGRLDVVRVEASMPVRQRWTARRRARTGTHLPHPMLHAESTRSVAIDLGHPVHVWLDGQWWGRAESLEIAVLPDAAVVLA